MFKNDPEHVQCVRRWLRLRPVLGLRPVSHLTHSLSVAVGGGSSLMQMRGVKGSQVVIGEARLRGETIGLIRLLVPVTLYRVR